MEVAATQSGSVDANPIGDCLTDIDNSLGNGIRSGDDLRIGLEITLGGNQVDQLLGKINV
jgi:hypothetical protein